MSTSCLIGLECHDGTIRAVRCQCDGYPGGVGIYLCGSYNTAEKILDLIEHEEIRELRYTIEESEFYTESGFQSRLFINRDYYQRVGKRDLAADYLYLFSDGRWLVYGFLNDPEWNQLSVVFGNITPPIRKVHGDDAAAAPDRRKKAADIMRMDTVIRMINDDENGIFEHWVTEFVADGDGINDVMDYPDFESFHQDACEYFAQAISRLITEGKFTNSGYSREFYNKEFDKGVNHGC